MVSLLPKYDSVYRNIVIDYVELSKKMKRFGLIQSEMQQWADFRLAYISFDTEFDALVQKIEKWNPDHPTSQKIRKSWLEAYERIPKFLMIDICALLPPFCSLLLGNIEAIFPSSQTPKVCPKSSQISMLRISGYVHGLILKNENQYTKVKCLIADVVQLISENWPLDSEPQQSSCSAM